MNERRPPIDVAAIRRRLDTLDPVDRERMEMEAGALAIGQAAQDLAERHQRRGDFDTAALWWAIAVEHGTVDMDSACEELQLAADPAGRARLDEEAERAHAFFQHLFNR